MNFVPQFSFIVFTAVFFVLYTGYLVRNTVRSRLDLADFVLLMSVAVIPAAFVVFPDAVVDLARLVGVGYPFLLLFGALFVLVFLYLHRLLIRANQNERTIRVLVQELAIHRATLAEHLGALPPVSGRAESLRNRPHRQT